MSSQSKKSIAMTDTQEIEDEIRDVLGDKIQYDLERMFPDREGALARRRVKGKLKLLKNLAPSLATALVDGEELIYVARGHLIYSWERLVLWWGYLLDLGPLAFLANITRIVLTDRRILFVNTNIRGKQKLFRNQLLYTEIAEAKMGSFLSNKSTLELKDGKTLTIGGFKRVDRKYIQQYVPELISSMPDGVPQLGRSVQYLCPHCPAIYIGLQSECTNCGTTFKSPAKAALMSLFLPGLGDLYLGHTLFGLSELLASLVEWFALLVAIDALVSGNKVAARFLFAWIPFMGLTNVMDYFLTRAMGRKGLIASSGSAITGTGIMGDVWE